MPPSLGLDSLANKALRTQQEGTQRDDTIKTQAQINTNFDIVLQRYKSAHLGVRTPSVGRRPLPVPLVDHAGHVLQLREAGVREQGGQETLLPAQLAGPDAVLSLPGERKQNKKALTHD